MTTQHIRSIALSATLFGIGSVILFQSCDKTSPGNVGKRTLVLPEETDDYVSELEKASETVRGFNNHNFEDMSNEAITLGRVLFYDPMLSQNNRTSCASCHRQVNAFADPDRFSSGFINEVTTRNSMGIQNLFARSEGVGFFWDGRATTLEEQVLMPIRDHIEMGMDNTEELLERLEDRDYYGPLFEKAFGTEEITEARVSTALTQFVKAIPSFRSKYDEGRDINYSNFNAMEKRGFELFFTELTCGNCHQHGTFENYSLSNIGLDMVYADKGRGEWDTESGSWVDGTFLTPTLRNIVYTAPYMHDGRYKTLEEVIEFYNSGVQAHNNLDYRLRDFEAAEDFDNPGPRKWNLSENDKNALIAFLHTLSDKELLTDPKYSDPFVLEDGE